MPPEGSLIRLERAWAIGERALAVLVAPLSVMLFDLLLLRLLGLFSTLLNHFNVVIQDGSNHRDHVGLHNPSPDGLRSPDTNIDDALEGKIPLPHAHHILASALLENAD